MLTSPVDTVQWGLSRGAKGNKAYSRPFAGVSDGSEVKRDRALLIAV